MTFVLKQVSINNNNNKRLCDISGEPRALKKAVKGIKRLPRVNRDDKTRELERAELIEIAQDVYTHTERERVIIMCVCMRSGTSIGFEVENNTLR